MKNKAGLNDMDVRTDELKITEYEMATIVPRNSNNIISPGLYDKNGCYVSYSGKRKIGTTNYVTEEKRYTEKERFINKDVYYIGDMRCHWGHFLADETPRMWAMMDQPKEVCIAVFMAREQMPHWLVEFFDICGINRDRIIVVTESTRFKKVLFPELSYLAGKYVHPVWRDFFDRITLKYVDTNKQEKIYLSRTELKYGPLSGGYGETIIQNIFKENGYRIVHPQKMSVSEQLSLYANATSVVTTNGTLGHNVLFSKKNVELILLLRDWEHSINFHQEAIDMLMEINPITIDCADKKGSHALSYIKLQGELKDFLRQRNFNIKNEKKVTVYLYKEYLEFVMKLLLTKLKHCLIANK